MRKNNSKTLKSPSRTAAKASSRNGSTRSAKPSNGRITRTTPSAAPTKPHKNSSRDPFAAAPDFNKLLENALDYKNREDYPGAAKAFNVLVRQFPESPTALWLLGATLYYRLKKPRLAIPHFKKATVVAPRSERSSLGLFHCLWNLDMVDEALEELKRYQLLTNWSSEDYREILSEILEKWVDEDANPTKKTKSKKKHAP